MPRALPVIVEDLVAAVEGGAYLTKVRGLLAKATFAEPASATSGLQNYDLEGTASERRKRRRKRRQDAEAAAKSALTERAENIGKLLTEMKTGVHDLAAQPLPMGTSSVSPQFPAPSDGRQDFGKIADKIGASE